MNDTWAYSVRLFPNDAAQVEAEAFATAATPAAIQAWTLDPKAIATPAVAGDVNGDGMVNISDINALINYILSGGFADAADVNGDGAINIADVNAVIGIILS